MPTWPPACGGPRWPTAPTASSSRRRGWSTGSPPSASPRPSGSPASTPPRSPPPCATPGCPGSWSRARSKQGPLVTVGYVGGLHRRHGVRRLPEPERGRRDPAGHRRRRPRARVAARPDAPRPTRLGPWRPAIWPSRLATSTCSRTPAPRRPAATPCARRRPAACLCGTAGRWRSRRRPAPGDRTALRPGGAVRPGPGGRGGGRRQPARPARCPGARAGRTRDWPTAVDELGGALLRRACPGAPLWLGLPNRPSAASCFAHRPHAPREPRSGSLAGRGNSDPRQGSALDTLHDRPRAGHGRRRPPVPRLRAGAHVRQLWALLGEEAFNEYAHHLRELVSRCCRTKVRCGSCGSA